MKRASRELGKQSYSAYLERRRERSAVPPLPFKAQRVRLHVATCTGADALSKAVNRRICFVGVEDACPETQVLRETRHGCWFVDPSDRLSKASGWDDWTEVPVCVEMAAGGRLSPGVDVAKGSLSVCLDARISPTAFAKSFAVMMSGWRFVEACSAESAMLERRRLGLPLYVSPRYTAPAAFADGFRRADDLYVFDPWTDLHRLAVVAGAASLSLITSAGSSGA